MSIDKEDLHRLVDRLRDEDKKTAYDFLRYLIDRQRDPYDDIDRLEPDNVPLSSGEREQFDDKDDRTISLEDIKRELKV